MSQRLFPESFKLSTIIDILRWRSLNQPQEQAYAFLLDGELETAQITYAELDIKAQAIAALLSRYGAMGERVLMLYPPGLDYITTFFGCLYAGVIAIPAYPPRNYRTAQRIKAILADAQATIALTTTETLPTVQSILAEVELHWLTTDNLASSLGHDWHKPAIDNNTLAFLQYTSGSTGTPKGVMVSHGNLVYNSTIIYESFTHTSDSSAVIWLPPYHDMGLIGGILQPLYCGARVTLMSPVHFIQKPYRWLQAISHYKATNSGGPNFAYDLCVRKIEPEQKANLDLSCWEVAFTGAEPVRAEILERFAASFASCGFRREAFYPCYGLAEATLFVSGGLKTVAPTIIHVDRAVLKQNQVVTTASESEDSLTIVSCGRSYREQKIVIVDPQSSILCPANRVGEIWVSGASVTQGYWQQLEETKSTFQAYLKETGEGPFLRTGDLGFLKDGELFITGRCKDLIVIRGCNHYPQDIEQTVEQSHPALQANCCTAFSAEIAGEERLVIIQEVQRQYRNPDVDEVAAAIRANVAKYHDLQVYAIVLIKTGSIPKTSSGKIQRFACQDAFMTGSLNALGSSILQELDTVPVENQESLTLKMLIAARPEAQQSLLKSYIQEQVAKILKIAPSQFNLQQPISILGLDSLTAIELKNSIEANLNVVLPIENLLQDSSITQLAIQILAQLTSPSWASPAIPIPTTQLVFESTLSQGQQALWFLHQLAPSSAAYNIMFAARIRSPLDIPALENTFQALVDRHPSLRTIYIERHGQPIQKVENNLKVNFQEIDASFWSEEDLNNRLIEQAHYPFALAEGALFRIRLFTRSPKEYILLFAIHHIAIDLWSIVILIKELSVLYPAAKANVQALLPPINLQYTDYVRWQTELLASSRGKKLWTYWRQHLSGELPVLKLPTDRPRTPIQTYSGASHIFDLGKELTQQLQALAKAEGATFYMILLAAFQVLLFRYTHQKDILVGSPIAGRNRAEFEGLVGYFVNIVVMKADFSGNPTFKDFLDQVRHTVIAALEHQDFPFNLLVERLQASWNPSYSPIFQVLFVLEKPHHLEEISSFVTAKTQTQINLGGLKIEPFALEQRSAQFDLTLRIVEVDGSFSATWQYNTDLFNADTIVRMTGHFTALLQSIVADPAQPISTLQLLTESEQYQLLVEKNDSQRNDSYNKCVHELFEEQVEKFPDAIAVVFEEEQFTYQELNSRANQLARGLQSLGIGPEVLVGIYLERSLDMIVAILGILKAGGAYVPLDPTYPKKRLEFILADTKAAILLTHKHLAENCPEHITKIICLDTGWEDFAQERGENLPNLTVEQNLVYVIYTSGSTGRPKGVAIEQKPLLNYIQSISERLQLKSGFSFATVSTIAADLGNTVIYSSLCSGGCLHIVSQKRATDAAALADYFRRYPIDYLKIVPSHILNLLFYTHPEQLLPWQGLIIGGEAWNWDLSEKLAQLAPNCLIFNHYGPTESTIGVMLYQVEQEADRHSTIRIPLGDVIANTQIYLLDAHLQPVPMGVTGELYIGGTGLARGYLNSPTHTAEKFIPNPFSNQLGARLYRTGDLARYLADGNINFIGRLDYQVKIRGFRIETAEIEAVLAQHPFIEETVVLMRENASGEKHLVAYYVVSNPQETLSLTELRNFLRAKLPEYMIPTTFVLMDRLPLTINGKCDRHALPIPATLRPGSDGDFVAPGNLIEDILANIWIQILGIEQVGIQDNFFDLGGHSLLATQLMSRIREIFQVELPVSSLFETPTIVGLCETIKKVIKAEQGLQVSPIVPIPRDQQLPLSFAQQRLWFLDRLQPGNPYYNCPALIRMVGHLDISVLEQTLSEIVRRHEVLRTTFPALDGLPSQIVTPPQPISLPIVDLSQLSEAEREAETWRLVYDESQQSFDLAQDPLLRTILLRQHQEEMWFMINVHHIVCDSWSKGVLIQELVALYTAFYTRQPSPLPELAIQYADFAYWQRQWLQNEILEKQLSYWKQQLNGAPAVLGLPTDRTRPAVQTFRGAYQTFKLPTNLYQSLQQLSRQEGVTLYMTLLAVFKTLLSFYTGGTDIIVGTDIANRNQLKIEGLIGFFINQLVLRTNLSGDPSFRNLLLRVRKITLEAYANQDLPFEKLVEVLKPERSLKYSPLFQVKFILQNVPKSTLDLPNLTLNQIEIHNGTAQFDLILNLTETEQELTGTIEYSTELFNPVTITRMIEHLKTLLHTVVVKPDAQLSSLKAQLVEVDKQYKLRKETKIKEVSLEKLNKTRRKNILD